MRFSSSGIRIQQDSIVRYGGVSMTVEYAAGIVIERKQACVTRDQITLYADIYRPKGDGPFPVLLMRQPYGRAIASTVTYAHPIWFARHGYMVVIQDVRGRGDSEGEFVPFLHEAKDGYDSVEWAASLPFSNGRVGMYGFSYQGSTQWAAASERPPHLTAIAPGMCAADLYHGMFYPHGRFMLVEHLPWAFQLARDTVRRKGGDPQIEEFCTQVRCCPPQELLSHMPILDPHPILQEYFPSYYEWCLHSEYDEFWQQRSWLQKLAAHPVPSLNIGGWYDYFLMGTLQSYEELRKQTRTPELFHRLIVGPWEHIPWGRQAGGVDHGTDAGGGIHQEQLRWFDFWLKQDKRMDMYNEPQIRYFELESNRWHTARQASPFGKTETSSSWYMSGSANPANGAQGGGRLVASAAEIQSAPPDVFVYDARMPMKLESYLPLDRSSVQDRYEILVYTSMPLAEDMHIFGAPSVTVHVQTIGGPTDLVAIISVVKPDGASRFLSVGRTEIGTQQGEGEAWERAVISMRPMAVQLEAGCSVRLELTGSAFPFFARHPNGIAADIHQVGSEKLYTASVVVCSTDEQISVLKLPILQE